MHYHHQSIDDGHSSNYEPLIKQKIMISSNSSGGSSSTTQSNLRPLKASLRRDRTNRSFLNTMETLFYCSGNTPKSRNSDNQMYKKCAAVFFILFILLLLLVIYLIFCLYSLQNKYITYDQTGSIYYHHHRLNELSKNNLPISDNVPQALLALPKKFRLGEIVSGDLPPGQIIYTEFSVQHDNLVQFNISVGPKARIALYARQTLKPSLTSYNYIETIRGDYLHVAGIVHRHRRELTPKFKSALVTFQLLSGKWHLGFFNDGLFPEPISFVASITKKEKELQNPIAKTSQSCKYDCFSKGFCKNGKCHCHPGYSGEFCEETACPVLCSGNGIFTNGRCSCHEGFKGLECDIDARWCAVPNCNHHGQCDANGECICDRGWTGEYCDIIDCYDPTCSMHGICKNATCYCSEGWYGKNCEQRISNACSPLELYKTSSFNNLPKPEEIASPLIIPTNNKNDSPMIEKPKKEMKETANESFCKPKCEHGNCQNGICVCEEQWAGVDCSQKLCLPGCEVHGICNKGICECNQGWNGENCFIEGCPNNCSNTGSCQQFKGLWQCACDSSHYGPNCEFGMETDCDDGIDNDEDGLTDCEDSECCSSRTCSGNPLCTSDIQPSDVLLRIQPPVDASFFQRNRFLIEQDSVQRYATVELFNESRVSIIRGNVVSSKGGALVGVRISDTANPRFGFSLSRSEDDGGAFDLMVNGGGFVTLQFLRKPFGKVEKSFFVPSNDIVYVGNVIMNEAQSSILLNREIIIEKCKNSYLEGNYAPKIIPSWSLRQYSGEFESHHNSETTKVIADARVLHDNIPIEGTEDMELVYSSDRAHGFQSTLHIALLPSKISDKLRLVHVKINVAGRGFQEIFVAKSNLTYVFAWDHSNVYKQAVYGLTKARVSIGYEFEGCSKKEEIVWRHENVLIEGKKSRKMAFGLWSFNFHHYYDFINNVLERGDGLTQYLEEIQPIVKTLVGSEKQREAACSTECMNQTLSDAKLFQPTALAVACDGTVYIGDYNMVRRINSDRSSIDVILELSSTDTVHSYYLAIDPSNDKLYISIPQRRQIWTIKSYTEVKDPLKNYKIIAGDGTTCVDANGACGDGGAADSAQLNFPKDITFDNNGNMFVIDGRRIRYITKDRKIDTLVSSPEWKPTEICKHSFALKDLNLEWPLSIVFEPFSLDLIILDADVIYRLNIEAGTVRILAGTQKGCDSTAHGTTVLEHAQSITISPDIGKLYIAESDSKKHNFVRSLSVNGGRIETIAGRSSKCDCDRINCPCDDPIGQPPMIATQSFLHKPVTLAVDSQGHLYVGDQANYKIKIIEKIKPIYDEATKSYRINSPATNEIYYFNKYGMHQKTVSLLSDQLIYNFKYSIDTTFGELSEIEGVGGSSLRITRVNESDIILDGPMPQKTVIKLNTFDRQLLQEVKTLSTNGQKVELNYENGQLLKTKQLKDKTIFVGYDKSGRVTTFTKSTGEQYTFSTNYSLGNFFTTNVKLNGKRFRRFSSMDNEYEEAGKDIRSLTNHPDMFIFTSKETRNQFDGVSHPLLQPNENAFLKRKITLPSVEEPMRRELSSRFEWRSYLRTKDGKRIITVNGRNAFTIEFDRNELTDIIRDAYDNDLFSIKYTPSGQVSLIKPLGDLNIATLNITNDANGNPLNFIWVDLRQDFAYDSFQRLIASTYSRKGDLLVRKYTYGHDNSYHPSMIQMPSGEMYKWIYNKDGGIFSLKSPNDEITEFWGARGIQIEASGILYRRMKIGAHYGVATAIYDSKNRLTEFISIDGNRRVELKRDEYGQIISIKKGKQNVVFKYDKHGRIKTATSEGIKREFVYQGPLIVAMKQQSLDSPSSVYFSTEYDDLLRPTSIHVNFNGTALEPIRFEYDHLTGRANKIGRSVLTTTSNKKIISNDIFSLTTDFNKYQQIQNMDLTISGLTVLQLQTTFDSIGRLESMTWIIEGQSKPLETRGYAIDGGISEYSLGDADKHLWTILYDSSGKMNKINGKTVKFYAGGAAHHFGTLNYTVDSNGWTLRRGSYIFEYDSLGQLKRATNVKEKGEDFVYEYDEEQRIVARKYLHTNRIQRFYYAFTDRRNLITHFTDSKHHDSVWTIHYSDTNIPFLLECSSGTRHILVTDPTNSLRYIFTDRGTVAREISYSPMGNSAVNTNPHIFIPIGYQGNFHDFEAGIIFVRENANGIMVTRPLDDKLGRFLSTTPALVSYKLDTFNPEYLVDPFKFEHFTTPLKIPSDPIRWLSISGTEIKDIIPLTKFSFHENNFCQESTIVSGVICAFEQQLSFFSQIMTLQPSKFIGHASDAAEKNTQNHYVDISLAGKGIGSCGIALTYDQNSNTQLFIQKSFDQATVSLLEKVLSNTSFVVQYFSLPEPRLNNTGVFEIHLAKVGQFGSASDDLTGKHESKIFNMTLKNSQLIEISSDGTVILVHYHGTPAKIRNQAYQNLQESMIQRIWHAERAAVKKGTVTSQLWNDKQRQELLNLGRIREFIPKPKNSSDVNSIREISEWHFEKV
uniref:EGF-like domain-containing protein n=1 Tax=Panagrolaimus sp. PS1159 TaxID=55785 RepID=A0AC35GBY9_9BILA